MGFDIKEYLENYVYIDSKGSFNTKADRIDIDEVEVYRFINEFWTAKQRQASSIHEVSYRACFKPQLPRFFIELLTKEGDVVYDPFSGRGTTVIEAGIMGRAIIANDINPLSHILSSPRFFIPDNQELKNRLDSIDFSKNLSADIDLSMFYHPWTEGEIVNLKKYLLDRKESGKEDHIDRWIRMVATNRLTGHSGGFFSVYTLPPNQAVTQESQIKINEKRNQIPDYREVKPRILQKSTSLLKSITEMDKIFLNKAGELGLFLTKDVRDTKEIESSSVQLIVTSPPFLDIVQYSQDNWLRCWFNAIDDKEIAKKITMAKTLGQWSNVMGDAFKEFYRIIKPGGWVAFEVGEVKNGKVKLDEHVVPLGINAGFTCEGILINLQEFTKTSNIWGINNNNFGTNTNRIVVFRKQ
jgi:DNA modification methylase